MTPGVPTRYDAYRDRWNGGRAGMPVHQRWLVVARVEGVPVDQRRVPGWFTKAEALALAARLSGA